jgi:hypothetical protein
MNQAVKKQDKPRILKKHVAAIHINAKLSLLQRKLANALLYNSYENLLTEKEHKIKVDLLCEMIGFDSKNIPYLKASLKGLMETIVEFDMLDDDGENVWQAASLLPEVSIKGNICLYSYTRKLAEKLYHPDIYSKINLSVLKEMKSTHALVLYENCYRYIGTEHGRTAVWDVDVFRKLMAVDDMASYKPFKALNRNVIQPAMAEVNKVSNINLELITHRKGRAVVSVQFIVKPNPQLSLLPMENDDEITERRAYKELLREGISKTLARSWVLEYDDEYILNKIAFANDRASHGKIKSSKSGFLKSAIEQDYKSQNEVDKAKLADQDKRRDEKYAKEVELSRLQKILKNTERQHRENCLERIQSAFEPLSKNEAENVKSEFQASLSNRVYVDDFKKNTWNARSLLSNIYAYWENRGVSLPSPNEFIEGDEFKTTEMLQNRIKKLESQLER